MEYVNNSVKYKKILKKFKKIETIHTIFSDHNGIKLESNNRKIFEKSPIMWKLNNMLLNNNLSKEEIVIEIKIYCELNEQ